MRRQALLVLAALMLLTPLFPLGAGVLLQRAEGEARATKPQHSASAPAPKAPAPAETPTQSLPGRKTLKVYDSGSGRVVELAMADYVAGAVAAELPPGFPLEALRAQAVAAHSYALYCARWQESHPDPALCGAALSVDLAACKGTLTEEGARRLYGERFEEYWTRIRTAADSVSAQALAYEGEPALTVYSACSAGVTEAAAEVWGTPVPYLIPVESLLDLQAPDCELSICMPREEVEARLAAAFPKAALGGEPGDWLALLEFTPSGYVRLVSVGGERCSGVALRSALGLRSAHFSVRYADEVFTFTTRGYGHGVGLSQQGARALAEAGKGYAEILAHYYPGTTLCETV